MSKVIKKQIEWAGKTLSLESGRMAFQANRAVLAQYGDTVVLATVVANEASEDLSYFPLRIDYEEKLYAGGLIKGSRFIKREGRPRDEATTIARLMDHAIRPLFPADFGDDVQVIVTVLSVEPEGDPELVAIVAASAALHSSDIPWLGPIGTVRVTLQDGKFLVNPPLFAKNGQADFELLHYDLNIIPSFREGRLVAVEGEGREVPEDQFLAALELAQKEIAVVTSLIADFAKEVGASKYSYEAKLLDQEMLTKIHKLVGSEIKQLVVEPRDKLDRVDAYNEIVERVQTEFESKHSKANMKKGVDQIEKKMTQELVLKDGKRPDGRAFNEVRPLAAEVGLLPRTHGSALFTRGLTQALTITTLASTSAGQIIQSLISEETKRYIHHYYGRPFSLGETGALRSPGRREIGHGALAEKALLAVLPSKEEFPYTMRVVSEVLSQNGSSSMAATCGSTLSLMDAGVPIKASVGGVAIGLMVDESSDEDGKYVVLTDIAGVEDFNGYLDFKMPGTRKGMTAVQMDTKLKTGVTMEVIKEVVEASRKGREVVLEAMEQCLAEPRAELSVYAPKITIVMMDPRKIGELIGPGGKIIKRIIEETGADINVEDDGAVSISTTDDEQMKKAQRYVEGIAKGPQAGEVYEGTVMRVMDFGAFVEILPGQEGLVHVSELAHEYVERVEDVVKEGEKLQVKVLGTDDRGRLVLSKKALEDPPADGGDRPRPYRPRPGGSDRPLGRGSAPSRYDGRRSPSPAGRSGPRRSFGPDRARRGGPGQRTPYRQRSGYR